LAPCVGPYDEESDFVGEDGDGLDASLFESLFASPLDSPLDSLFDSLFDSPFESLFESPFDSDESLARLPREASPEAFLG
jgi:hypothetical protein